MPVAVWPPGPWVGPGFDEGVAEELSVDDGATLGEPDGIGVWSQIGMLGLSVRVGSGVGVGFGVGGGVGSGLGGTRVSGNPGSPAAERVCERFQSGPYGPWLCCGCGVRVTTGTELSICSLARPRTRSPMRSPRAIAARSTSTPAAST